MDTNYTAHLQRIQTALTGLGPGGSAGVDGVKGAVWTAFGELIEALTDLATELDTVKRRLDALEKRS